MISPDESYHRGDDAVLFCEVIGGLENEIRWLFGEEVLNNSTSVEIVRVNDSFSRLTLLNLTTRIGGEYTCEVTNINGTSSAISSVFIFPYFTAQPQDVRGANGTSVNMTCEAEAFPQPTYQWRRVDGRQLGETVTGGSSSVLQFAPIQFTDSGVYTCVVTSGNNTNTSNATLTGRIKLVLLLLNHVYTIF